MFEPAGPDPPTTEHPPPPEPLEKVTGGGGAAALIVTEKSFVDEALSAPVTRTVKLVVPSAVGIPSRTPAADRLRPAGTLPADTDQLYGVVPPVAASVWLYAIFTAPAGSETVVIVGAAAALTVRLTGRVVFPVPLVVLVKVTLSL
jgi:hypothetical protein